MAVGKLARSQLVISGERLGVLCYHPAAGVFLVAAEVFPVVAEVFPVGNPCFVEPLFEIARLGFQLPTYRRKLPLVRWRVSQL